MMRNDRFRLVASQECIQFFYFFLLNVLENIGIVIFLAAIIASLSFAKHLLDHMKRKKTQADNQKKQLLAPCNKIKV